MSLFWPQPRLEQLWDTITYETQSSTLFGQKRIKTTDDVVVILTEMELLVVAITLMATKRLDEGTWCEPSIEWI